MLLRLRDALEQMGHHVIIGTTGYDVLLADVVLLTNLLALASNAFPPNKVIGTDDDANNAYAAPATALSPNWDMVRSTKPPPIGVARLVSTAGAAILRMGLRSARNCSRVIRQGNL